MGSRDMKTTVLVDNTDGIRVKGEWGLSFYIEYEGKCILLDAGLSNLFASNAEILGLSLGDVDFAVLSHAHDDHANGLVKFLQMNGKAKLYIANGCYEDCYDRKHIFHKYAGIPKGMLSRFEDRIVRSSGKEEIAKGVWILGHSTPGLEAVGVREKMFRKEGLFKYRPDDFNHEQSLIFELEDGIVIFNSCSHAGADVIIREAMEQFPGKRILAMIGGFHLYKRDEEYVRQFAKRVEETGVESIYTGHCTGENSLKILEDELGDKVHRLMSGMVFEI